MRTFRAREARLAYILLIPSLMIILGIVIFPLLYNVWLSFHDVTLDNLGDQAPFAGIGNYAKVLGDVQFVRSLVVTLVYSVSGVLLSLIIGLAAALLLNRSFRGRALARGIFLFPYVAPAVSLAFIWKWMLNPVYGVGNWTLVETGIIQHPIAWLSVEPLALFTVILFEGWRYFPFDMLFILARLQAIPHELYEAADVDGAGAGQKFLYITLPELKYILAALFLLRFIWTVNKFDDIFLLTGGAAGTKVLPLLIYDYSFRTYDFGMGAAISMLLFFFLLLSMATYVKKVINW